MEFFKFFERRRLRKEEAAREAHARQLELVDLALRRVVDVVREQQQALFKALEAQNASTELIASWLKSFAPAPAGDQPTFSTAAAEPEPEVLGFVRDIAAEFGEDVPSDFKLALALNRLDSGALDERDEPDNL
jgi:hypothetical protein